MLYVTKTIHTWDYLDIRGPCKNKLHSQNEDDLPAHRLSMGARAIAVSKSLLIGSNPLPCYLRHLCKIYEVPDAPNYQPSIRARKIFNFLISAARPLTYRFKISSGRLLPGEKLLTIAPTKNQSHWEGYFPNLAMKLPRLFAPYFSLSTPVWLANENLYSILSRPYGAFCRVLISLLKVEKHPAPEWFTVLAGFRKK